MRVTFKLMAMVAEMINFSPKIRYASFMEKCLVNISAKMESLSADALLSYASSNVNSNAHHAASEVRYMGRKELDFEYDLSKLKLFNTVHSQWKKLDLSFLPLRAFDERIMDQDRGLLQSIRSVFPKLYSRAVTSNGISRLAAIEYVSQEIENLKQQIADCQLEVSLSDKLEDQLYRVGLAFYQKILLSKVPKTVKGNLGIFNSVITLSSSQVIKTISLTDAFLQARKLLQLNSNYYPDISPETLYENFKQLLNSAMLSFVSKEASDCIEAYFGTLQCPIIFDDYFDELFDVFDINAMYDYGVDRCELKRDKNTKGLKYLDSVGVILTSLYEKAIIL